MGFPSSSAPPVPLSLCPVTSSVIYSDDKELYFLWGSARLSLSWITLTSGLSSLHSSLLICWVLLQFPENSLLVMLLFNEQFLYVSWIRIHLLEKLSPNLLELEYLEAKERFTQMGASPRTHASKVFTKPMLTWNDLKQQSIAWYVVSFPPHIWSLWKITF